MCAAPGSKTAQLIEYLHKDESSVPGELSGVEDRCMGEGVQVW